MMTGKEKPRTDQGKRGKPKKAETIIPQARTCKKPTRRKSAAMTPIERIRAAEDAPEIVDPGIDVRQVMAENAQLRADISTLRLQLEHAERELAFYRGGFLC